MECRAACFTRGVAGRFPHGYQGRPHQLTTDLLTLSAWGPIFCPLQSRARCPTRCTSVANWRKSGGGYGSPAHVFETIVGELTHKSGLPPTRRGVLHRSGRVQQRITPQALAVKQTKHHRHHHHFHHHRKNELTCTRRAAHAPDNFSTKRPE